MTGGPEAVATGGAAADPADVLDTAEAGRRVVTGGAIRLVGYGAGLLASLASAAVMFRYLGKVDYGRFGTVLALVTGIQLVTELGMTNLGVREYAQRSGEDRDRFMRVLLGMRLVTTVLMVAAAAGFSLLLGYDDEMVAGAILLGIAVSLAAITGTVGIPLQAEIRMGVVTSIDVARQIGTAAGYIVLCAAGAGIVALFGVSAPVYLVVLIVTYLYARGSMPMRPVFDAAEWGRLLRPTLVFALASAVGGLYVHAAMVLTELVATEAETGDFAAAFRVFVIVAAFPGLLAATAFPLLSRAARDDHERLKYATQRLFEGSALLGGAVVVSLVLGASVVMDVLGGEDYATAAPVLRIQGVALALTFVIASFGFTLLALHRHRAIIVANLCALAVSATSVLLLGSTHGAQGASFGVLLGELTLAVAYIWFLGQGGMGLRPRPGRAWRVLPPLAAALACQLLPLPALPTVVLGLLVFASGCLLCRAIPEELLDLLPGRAAEPPQPPAEPAP